MEADSIRTNFELQSSEWDLLRSMFPERNALTFDDPTVESDIKSWLEKGVEDDDPPVTFVSYKLTFDRVDVYVEQTQLYPSSEAARIYLKSGLIGRDNQSKVNKALNEYLEVSAMPGDLVLGLVVAWIQDNAESYFTKSDDRTPVPKKCKTPSDEDDKVYRLWLYSHHIYSKVKRKDILDLSSEFQLTGFSLPGKPGVVCLEGVERNCNEAWAVIKSWNWKKINVRFQEEGPIRKFKGFSELAFVKSLESRDYHMDMGEFFNFLVEHDSDHMFKELFGIDKKR